MALKELRDRLNGVNKKLNDIHQKAESDDRPMTDDERSDWDALTNEHQEIETRIRDAEFVESNKPADQSEFEEQRDRAKFDERRGRESGGDRPINNYERCQALTAWATRLHNPDQRGIEAAQRMGLNMNSSTIELEFDRGFDKRGASYGAPKSFDEIEEQRRGRLDAETRAQSIGTATAGGHTVPDEMMRPLERALLQFGGMRQVATIISTGTGADLPIPTTNDTGNVAEIIAENTVVNEQDMAFGQVVLGAYKYSSKMVKFSVELLQDSSVNLPSLIGSVLGERIGRGTNTDFTVGNGTSKPRGITLDSVASGVTTASNTALTYDEILGLKHSVDPAYRGQARFMTSDAILLIMKKMKDSDGRPLWLPSLVQGEPSTFDGDPLVINQDMPTGASSKAILYGDLSKYMIRDTRGISLMRLDERFADFHQVAFLAFARYDGRLIDAGTGPVKHLVLAA